MNNQIHIVENETSRYQLEQVNIYSGKIEPSVLYRILDQNGKVHYKKYVISGSKMRIEKFKGKSSAQIFDEAEELIESLLLKGDERNVEVTFLTDGFRVRELNEFGEPK